jgi:endonuclease/exonuclease/phosphatase family metal-dependent hydrolase
MNNVKKSSSWAETLLPALSLTLGLQIFRTIGPYLRDLLDDRLGWQPVLAGLVPFIVLGTVFLSGWFNRWLGLRRLLLLSAMGLGLARLGMQIWFGDPIGDMLLALIGTMCLSFFLPAYLAAVRSQPLDKTVAFVRFTGGILLGLALDAALHGAFLTYDFIWQAGLGPVLLAIALVAAQGVVLSVLLPTVPSTAEVSTFRVRPPWLALGPFLALQALVFQNPARLAALTGWSLPLAFGWVLISHVIGLWAVTIWPWRSLASTSLIGASLIVLLLPAGEATPLVEAIILLGGQVCSAILLTILGTALADDSNPLKSIDTGLIHGLGLLLMVVFMFLSYILYLNLPLPFEHGLPLSMAGLIIALCAVRAVSREANLLKGPKSWLAAKLALPLLVLPLFVQFTWHTPTSTISTSDSIRVMTYNVHNGFSIEGHLDLFALSQVIEAEQPDIIALQEVSRGSLVNGGVDTLSWLSQRLRLPYIFTPAGDGLWGQATLSRYPILLAENYALLPATTKRSFNYLQVDLGQEKPLHVINTHYQPRYGTYQIQLIHTENILNFLTQRQSDRFIIMGDLNAEPDMPQMQPFFEHGFIDVIENAGLVPGYTARSDNPTSRIDYILISSDLTATRVVIPSSTASDHLSVAATIQWE